MEKLLEGVRVLDLGRYIACPYCGLLLAGMGAEVIRLERPGGEPELVLPFKFDGWNYFSVLYAAGKKGITLDLTQEKGREIFKELVRRCDVVLENFSVDAAKAIGLEYEVLKEVNPRIIFVAITGFGQYGPYAHRVSFDPVAQAMSGAMSITGFPGDPPLRSGVNFVDYGTALHATLGTISALYHRERTGVGQMVDVSLLDTAVSFMGGNFALYKVFDWIRPQLGNSAHFTASDCFRAKDGWVYISIITDRPWRRLTEAMGREDLASDPRFATDNDRYENQELLYPIISRWVEERTVDEVVAVLEEMQIPCGRVNTIPEAFDDPHVRARRMIVDIDYPVIGKVPLTGFPIKFSETPGEIEGRGPLTGEHNQEIYCGLLGFSSEKLAELQEEGII